MSHMGLVIPELHLPFSTYLHPCVADAEAHLRTWTQHTGLLTNKPDRERAVALSAASQAPAWMYPYVDRDYLLLLAEWAMMTLVVDDLVDDTAEGRDPTYALRVADTLTPVFGIDTTRPPDSPDLEPFRTALADMWERTAAHMPTAWKHRMGTDYTDYLYSGYTHAAVNSTRVPLTETAYIACRLHSAVPLPFIDLIEMATSCCLPERLLSHPDVKAARLAAAYATCWSNDLHSAPKEIACGELCNYLAVLRYHNGLSLDDAAQKVARLFHDQVNSFVDAKHRLRTGLRPQLPVDQRHAIDAMLTGLEHIIAGAEMFSSKTLRYHDKHVAE